MGRGKNVNVRKIKRYMEKQHRLGKIQQDDNANKNHERINRYDKQASHTSVDSSLDKNRFQRSDQNLWSEFRNQYDTKTIMKMTMFISLVQILLVVLCWFINLSMYVLSIIYLIASAVGIIKYMFMMAYPYNIVNGSRSKHIGPKLILFGMFSSYVMSVFTAVNMYSIVGFISTSIYFACDTYKLYKQYKDITSTSVVIETDRYYVADASSIVFMTIFYLLYFINPDIGDSMFDLYKILINLSIALLYRSTVEEIINISLTRRV